MRRLCAQKQCNIITKYLHSQRIHVDRSICVWACPARCDLAPELWASGTAAVPGVQPIVTPVVVNWHSRLAKLRAAPHCRDCTAFILPAASNTHHTLLPHWPGKHDWCCSLEHQSIFSYILNLLHSCCISLLKPPNRAEVCPWKPSLLCTSYAVCCYTFASNLLLLLIHLDWNSKLVWRCPELFIGSTYKDKSGHEMHLGAEVNVVRESERCSMLVWLCGGAALSHWEWRGIG